MTENRRCDGHRDDDWLDEEAAERLLRGESVMPGDVSGDAVAARLARLLAAAAAPAAVDPDREDAAAAAFRTTFNEGLETGSPEGFEDADFLSVVRLGRPVTLPGAALTARTGRTVRTGRASGAPRSLKASAGALVAAVALCAAALAASPGILPLPFDGDKVGSAPVHSGSPDSVAPDGSGTQGPEGGSAPLTGGTGAAPHGGGASSQPGPGTTPSPGRPLSPGTPPASKPPFSHPPASQGTRGERDKRNVELCRAYVKAGGRVDTASSDRLAAAAGSKRDVPKYCARVLAADYLEGVGDGDSDDSGAKSGGTGGHKDDGDSRHDTVS